MANPSEIADALLTLTLLEEEELKRVLKERFGAVPVRSLTQKWVAVETDGFVVSDPLGVTERRATGVDSDRAVRVINWGDASVVTDDSSKDTPETLLEDNQLDWVIADWLALGQEAKHRAASLDETLSYVQTICNRVIEVKAA